MGRMGERWGQRTGRRGSREAQVVRMGVGGKEVDRRDGTQRRAEELRVRTEGKREKREGRERGKLRQ